jgi:hypothetical protein
MRRVRDTLPDDLSCTARWLDVDPLTRPSNQYDLGPALNRHVARICLADVARAQTVIAYCGARRSNGLDVEIGAALAHGIPVVLVGEPRCSFDLLPGITVADTLSAAIDMARP